MDKQEFKHLEMVARIKANEAIKLDNELKYTEALDAYVAAGSALSELARFASSNQETHQRMAMVYFQRAEALEKTIAVPPPSAPSPHHSQHHQQQRQQQPQHNPRHESPRPPKYSSHDRPQQQHQHQHQHQQAASRSNSRDEEAASVALIEQLMREEQAARSKQAEMNQRKQEEEAASMALIKQLQEQDQKNLERNTSRRPITQHQQPPSRTPEAPKVMKPNSSTAPRQHQQQHQMTNSNSVTSGSTTPSHLQPSPTQSQQQGTRARSNSNGHELVEFLSFPLPPNSKITATITLTTEQNEKFQGKIEAGQTAVKSVVETILRATTNDRDGLTNESQPNDDDNNNNNNNNSNESNESNGNTGGDVNHPENDSNQNPGVDEHGRIAGATHSLNPRAEGRSDSRQDSGVAYREKNWQDLVKRSQDKIGPPQKPFNEKVPISSTVSRAATRVNPSSKERAFAIDGYEKKTYIDPNRSIDVPLPKESPTQVVSGSAKNSITNAAALFETAAMGAKLRNTHKMGGERVKDMDHFVASVETPKVQLKIPDIAELVTEMAVEGLEDTNQVVVDETSSAMLHVQPRFRNEDGSVNPIISGHAKFFYSMVTKIVREFLRYSDPIELYYMTTIRADVSVCSLAKTNQRLYFNVLVFQQQQVYNLETGEIKEKRRIWTYWLQRAAMALASLRPNQPTGLYDKDIRSRFYQFLDSLEVDESDCEEEEL